MKLPWAWYLRAILIFPVVQVHTSTDPVTRYWPSGENWTHSTWDFWPNLGCSVVWETFLLPCLRELLCLETNLWLYQEEATPPAATSTLVPAVVRWDAGATLTSQVKTQAMAALLFSLLLLSEYACKDQSKTWREGFPGEHSTLAVFALTLSWGLSVCLPCDPAAPSSRSSTNSRTICS